MKYVFLVLIILGIILPYSQLLPIYNEHGFSFQEFIFQPFQNSITTFYAFDLMVTAIVSIIFIIYEGRRKNIKHLWLPIVSMFAVGISLALPLFLFMRELQLEKQVHGKYIVEFEEEIGSKNSQSETWDIVIKAFKNSKDVDWWPAYNWIRTSVIEKDATVEVDYTIFSKNLAYKYKIKELNDYRLKYSPIDPHPMTGEIIVKVEADGDKSRLIWKGKYYTNSIMAKYGFSRFSTKFFKDLRNNLSE